MRTTTEIVIHSNYDVLEKVIGDGDLSKLSALERLNYYNQICKSLGLNPLTQPFKYMRLNGKLTLYATKDATEQLRNLRCVSIFNMRTEILEGIYIVTVNARDGEGREDIASGAVSIEGLKGENRANAILKAETKAKRRVTLSICGLGFLDETEVESVSTAKPVNVCMETGEILTSSHPEPIEEAIIDTVEQLVGQMRCASTETTLRNIYNEAMKRYKDDPVAIQSIVTAKDKRKAELQSQIICEAV